MLLKLKSCSFEWKSKILCCLSSIFYFDVWIILPFVAHTFLTNEFSFSSVSWNIQNCLVKCDVILQVFIFHLKVYLFVIHWNLLSHVAGGFNTSAYRLILHLSKDFIFYFLNFHICSICILCFIMLQLSFEILIDFSFLFLIVIME